MSKLDQRSRGVSLSHMENPLNLLQILFYHDSFLWTRICKREIGFLLNWSKSSPECTFYIIFHSNYFPDHF